MIMVAHHYPSYAPCGLGLAILLNTSGFDDTIASEVDQNTTCATYGRDPEKNTIDKSCHEKDFEADTNITCAIGVNYTDYAGDAVDVISGLIENSNESNQSK
jgi:hypothetical protein